MLASVSAKVAAEGWAWELAVVDCNTKANHDGACTRFITHKTKYPVLLHVREVSASNASVTEAHTLEGRLSGLALGCTLRTELNFSILRLNFSISSGIFTKISQNFPNFLQSSLSLDILEHVREIPTKFHLNFGEK